MEPIQMMAGSERGKAAESDRIADLAAAWDARLRAPDCTTEDRRQFELWRDAAAEHRLAVERLQTIVAALRQERTRADLRSMRDAALALAERRSRRRRWTGTAAAAIVLGIAAWLIALRMPTDANRPQDSFVTGTGQRSTVSLQDGSTLELNAKTQVEVSFSAERRSVRLLDGQALFHIAKDADRPFIVQAGDREIVALGTAFDVRLNASDVRVTLLEGQVMVRPQGGSGTIDAANGLQTQRTLQSPARVASGRTGALPLVSTGTQEGAVSGGAVESVFLTPGQQLVVARSGSSHNAGGSSDGPRVLVRDIDVEKVISWRSGRVFLEELTLTQAVAEMNKYSVVQIVVADAALGELRVNGMFRAGEQKAFAHALEEYFPIVAEERGGTEIMLRARR